MKKLSDITRYWHIEKVQNPATGRWELRATRTDQQGFSVKVVRTFTHLPGTAEFAGFVMHLKQFTPHKHKQV